MNTTYLSALFSDLLNMIQSPLFSLGTQPITILWLAKCLLLLLVVLLTAKWSKLILKKRLLVGFVTNEGDREVISSLAAFATATIGIVLVLQAMGLKLESLAIIVGGMALVVTITNPALRLELLLSRIPSCPPMFTTISR